ncbi:hypothetical protein D5E70_24845 [Vibrio parahaemolyticus]|nr:hypothetical protein D5E70_24845 [Vibrio parahaemolyticus]
MYDLWGLFLGGTTRDSVKKEFDGKKSRNLNFQIYFTRLIYSCSLLITFLSRSKRNLVKTLYKKDCHVSLKTGSII